MGWDGTGSDGLGGDGDRDLRVVKGQDRAIMVLARRTYPPLTR